MRISDWSSDVCSSDLNPVVLVEGNNDEVVLNHVANVVGRSLLKFVTLPNFQDGESAGVDSLISYTRKNSRLLSRRPADSPLIILVDWEVSDSKLASLKQA